jgi:PAS domain S-box-containing protein
MSVELKVVRAISKAQSLTLQDIEARTIFDGLLETLLEISESEYGFIGESRMTGDGRPYLKTFAITDIAWDDSTSRFYAENAPAGLEFFNMETLFGHVLLTGEAMIANDPSNHPRSGGIPVGHPPLNAFLGLPFRSAGEVVGMVGLANRPGGYDDAMIEQLEPLLATCGNIVFARRARIERQQSLRSFRDQEALYRAILDASLDPIIITSDLGIVNRINPAAERLFGYSQQEMVGQSVAKLYAEPYRSQRDRDRVEYIRTGKSEFVGSRREIFLQRKDGSQVPVELTINALDMNDSLLMVGMVRDLTERRQAERRASEAYSELAKSRDDLLAILDQLQVGTIMIDAHGRVAFVSESCRFIEEIAGHGIVGLAWRDACPFADDDLQRLEQSMSQSPDQRGRIPITLDTVDGRRWWFDVVIEDDPRNTGGRILYLYDRSEIFSLRDELDRTRYGRILGDSAPMLDLYGLIDTVSQGDWTVLIEGETGVGKELVAHSIHSSSPRSVGPFIAVNCAGLSESLVASQLFGHRRGAFTGAVSDQEGFFEAAGGGTLFLDEIGDLPLSMQTSLLRALQEKEIIRLGESKPRKIDVRVLAATNRDLASEVRAGRFREDLLYRLRVARLRVPPLRERLDDLALLMQAFLDNQGTAGKSTFKLSPEVMELLEGYHWPGNVRELRNTVEYLVIHCRHGVAQPQHLPPEIRAGSGDVVAGAGGGDSNEDPTDRERARVRSALARAAGNRSRAARLLGISRATLYRRLSRLGITADS